MTLGILIGLVGLIPLLILLAVLPDWGDWLVAGVVFVAGTAYAARSLYKQRRAEWQAAVSAQKEAERAPGARLRDLSAEISASVQGTTRLMEELTRELHAQRAASEDLAQRADEQQRYLEVNEEQAEKIQSILASAAKSTIDATVAAGQRQQWTFFALGVLVSIPIGVAINLLVP